MLESDTPSISTGLLFLTVDFFFSLLIDFGNSPLDFGFDLTSFAFCLPAIVAAAT